MKKNTGWIWIGLMAVFLAGCSQSTKNTDTGENIEEIQESPESIQGGNWEGTEFLEAETEAEKNYADTKAFEDDSETTESESIPKPVEGETFLFGSYHGEPIEWAVIGNTDDKAL